jgi:hypothetical protein
MTPHTIRLRGPWEFQTLADSAPHKTPRVEIPGDLATLLAEYSGPVRFSRRFHKPSGLEGGARVELVVAGLPEGASILLNRELLPDRAPFRHDITPQLLDANLLTIEFNIELGAVIAADVCLQIFAAALPGT